MDRIAARLTEWGMDFSYATVKGKRVNPGNAYSADFPGGGRLKEKTLVLVECLPKRIPSRQKRIVIDHHYPGDQGFNKSCKYFWEGSSLGQLYKLLGKKTVPNQDLTLAAMDHCFGPALLGRCPGVSIKDVRNMKIAEIAEGTKTPQDEVVRRVQYFKDILSACEEKIIGNERVKDMRHVFLGTGYSLDLLAAQFATALLEKAALLCCSDFGDNEKEKVLIYNGKPHTIKMFVKKALTKIPQQAVYAAPTRGYAGAYRPTRIGGTLDWHAAPTPPVGPPEPPSLGAGPK